MYSMRTKLLASAGFRFLAWYTLLFSLSVAALALLLFLTIRSSLEDQARNHVEAETAQLLGDYRDDGLEELRHDIRERTQNHPGARLFYRVLSADGRGIFDELPAAVVGWQRIARVDQADLLIKGSPLNDGYLLLVAAELAPERELGEAMRNQVLLALALTLVLGTGGGLWLGRRFLAQINRLSITAERIGEGWLSERISRTGSGDEFDQLAATINRMLDRIESLVANVQQVSTHVAHDLRTPLGRLRLKLEDLADAPPAAAPDHPAQEAIAILDGVQETFAALLRIAEIQSGARRAGFTRVDLSACLTRLAEDYAAVAQDAGQELVTEIAEGLVLSGDGALLVQLFTNLIENAIRHSGPGSVILVGLQLDGAQLRASVRDNGKGVSAELMTEIAKPFVRADAARATSGSGLGLSLVVAIVKLHGARLHFLSASPGLDVIIEFPIGMAALSVV